MRHLPDPASLLNQFAANFFTNLLSLFLGFILGALIGGAPLTMWVH